jgi:superfamily II DNA or RNA helicase
VIVNKTILIHANELREKEWRKLLASLTFFDADRNEVHAYRRRKGGWVELPRGAWTLLPDHVEYEDRRIEPERRSLTFDRVLDYKDADKSFEGQTDALKTMLEQEQGLVIAQPGFGKTNVALAFICQVKTPGIVFVHTQDIFDQWVEFAEAAVPGIKIGKIQGDPYDWTHGDLDIAMVQTVRTYMYGFRKHWANKYGAVIVDEAHHAPADTWEMILNTLSAKYRFGFTATKSRADGMQPLMKHLIGPVIYEKKFASKVPVEVVPLKSGMKFKYRGSFDWTWLLTQITKSDERNKLIADTARRQIQKGNSVLILSRRIEHLELIEAELNMPDVARILTGRINRAKRHPTLEAMRRGEIKCLLATQLADEALDVPIVNRVMLVFPGKHDGRIIQQIGRGIREAPDKENAIIFDVVDDKVSVLRRQWMERKQTYDKLKIPIRKHKEVENVSQARQRREVADRVRRRLARGRSRRRGTRRNAG